MGTGSLSCTYNRYVTYVFESAVRKAGKDRSKTVSSLRPLNLKKQLPERRVYSTRTPRVVFKPRRNSDFISSTTYILAFKRQVCFSRRVRNRARASGRYPNASPQDATAHNIHGARFHDCTAKLRLFRASAPKISFCPPNAARIAEASFACFVACGDLCRRFVSCLFGVCSATTVEPHRATAATANNTHSKGVFQVVSFKCIPYTTQVTR